MNDTVSGNVLKLTDQVSIPSYADMLLCEPLQL
jgi:hypothetical protein